MWLFNFMKHNMKTYCLAFFVTVVIWAAGSCTLNDNGKVTSASNSKIYNGIQLQVDGLQVDEAFLSNGRVQINDDNKVKVGDRISVMLAVKGWKEKDGKVYIDASEKVTIGGDVLSSSSSLFGTAFPGGVLPRNAAHISLYQTIGRLKKYDEPIIVSFKVWDRLTNKSLSGSCKLFVEE